MIRSMISASLQSQNARVSVAQFRLVLVLLGCLAVVGTAAADEPHPWMVTAYLGASHTISNTVTLARPELDTQLSLAGVDYRSRSFESPQYYGLRFGRLVTNRVGVEVEWIHLKAYAETEPQVAARGRLNGQALDASVPLGSIVDRLSMSHGLNFLLGNAVLRQPIGSADRPRAWLEARGGIGVTVPHAESSIAGTYREQYEYGAVGGQLALGAHVRLTSHLGAITEYKFTVSSPTIDVAGGTASGRFTSHHVTAGLAWRY
jgi:hypothetical protein